MKKLIRFFIDRSFLVNLISAFIIIVGAVSFLNMKRDLIPTMKFNIVKITSLLKGASAIEMEKLVTFPIEENLDGLAGIDSIKSSTENGLSKITIEFESSHEEIGESVELIRARVNGIRSDLPSGMEPIIVERVSVDSYEFLDISINGISPENDHDRKWVHAIEDSFKKIRGVVKINSSMPDRKIFVDFKLAKLSRYGLSVDEVKTKISGYFSFDPVGSFSKNEKTVSVELRQNISSIESIRNLPISGNESGFKVSLADVANVEYRFPERKKITLYDGHQTVSFTVFKDISSDAIVLRDKVKNSINELIRILPSHIEVKITGDGAHFIEKQLNVLKVNGLGGLVIVMISLFFLLGFRVATMTAAGIPLAYFGTFIVLNTLGISIDLISVVGMILVIGILVDDAIIVTENYVLNLDAGLSPKEAATEAAYSTIKPVTGTVITTAVAFAPILFIKSSASQVLYSIPVVIITSLILSWFESFFILPNHLAHFVKSPSKRSDNNFFRKLRLKYEAVLKKAIKWRYIVLILLASTLIASFVLTGSMKKSFNLSIGSEYLQVSVELKESDSLEESIEKLKPFHDYLNTLRSKDVTFISSEIGSVFINNEFRTAYRFATAKIMINEDHPSPAKFREELKNKIKNKMETIKTNEFKNITIDTKTKGKDDQDIVSIFVSGGDKLSFEDLQEKLRVLLKKVPNVISLGDDSRLFQSSWQFLVNLDELLRYNVTAKSLAQQLSELFSPKELATFRNKGENIELFSQYKRKNDISFKELSKIKIITPKGIAIPVTKLGSWSQTKILKSIKHENLLRKFVINIRYDKEKTTKMDVAKNIKATLAPIIKEYPAFTFTVLEASEQEEKSKAWIISIAIICILLILLVLAICLNSVILPFIVMIPIPFGIIGIILALYLHGLEIEIMAIIGLIGMAGVVVNDSLIMVDSVNKQTLDSPELEGNEAILIGSSLRFRAIILTTVTTMGGVFPMAYGIGGESGFTQPLAFSMGWGLLFATFLTLFVLPALLAILNDLKKLFRILFIKMNF
ncbi:MAG: efflux RND transporter permease subunit [Halobacteriovoraceae bacterium]|jgi:multidrug efflux pump subunit AcrB|nr:efflux RND transporter permease subunit [Halobacteriovoraceae bacterium]MBT5094801.1 efflux RND transporter permease subunit [Halobacteriovoraceae bacterium]